METNTAKAVVRLARAIQESVRDISLPASEVMAPSNEPVLPHSLFQNTRGYLERIVYQINSSYEHTCYDACAVMIRRLVEVLIIEAFEKNGLGAKVKNVDGDFFYLQDLITAALAEPSWSLGRNTKGGLSKLKTIGDQSAHSRRYNARRAYIDEVIIDLRTVAEEFLYIAGLRH